jgi:hypothetical protein
MPTSSFPAARSTWVMVGAELSSSCEVVHGRLEPGDPARQESQIGCGALHCTVARVMGRSNPCTTGHRTSSPSAVWATVPSTS